MLPDSEKLGSCLYRLCVKLIEHIATQCQELFAGLDENEGNSREASETIRGGLLRTWEVDCGGFSSSHVCVVTFDIVTVRWLFPLFVLIR